MHHSVSPEGHEAKGVRGPAALNQEEIDEHNLTHLPYRSWCPWCVAGKRCNTPRRRIPNDRSIPMLSADYGFISDPGGALVTFLVATVAPYGVVFATVVPGKGPVPEVVRQLATWIQECGLVHFVYRTDRGHPITDLFRDAVRDSS